MRQPIAIFFVALALSSAPAVAETPAPVVAASVTVDYADLDLTSPTGAATLDARVENAAEKVCVRPDLRDLKGMQAFETCTAEARDAAMEQLSVANPFDGIELASAF